MHRRIFCSLVLAGLFIAPALTEEITARWELEASQAAVGQSLKLTLEIIGTDRFDPPDLVADGVDITFSGGGPHNSSSIVSINGKTTRTSRKSWVGSWSLKSSKVGDYHLDAQSLSVGTQTVFLPAINWRVVQAQNDSRFLLRQTFSQSVCVPGVEVDYELVWYVGQAAQNPEFTLPVLDNSDLIAVESDQGTGSGDPFRIDYKGRVLTGIKSETQLNGQQYTTLTLRFKVKATRSGRYDLSGTMVSFKGAVDSRQSQDIFGNIVNEPVYRSLVATADPLALEVKDLPKAGQPSPFSGLIGTLDLAWDVVPGTYRVGEPIRAALTLKGVLNKPDLDLDHMVISALSTDTLQVSPDVTAKAEDGRRGYIFRARRSGKLRVPAMKLNYFDPKSGRYGETATKPLSFDIQSVDPTRAAPAAGGTSAPNGSAADVSAPDGSAPVASYSGEEGLATIHPSALTGFDWPAIPWWAFSLPGLISGLSFGLIGLWRHSRTRRFLRERKAWRSLLGSLSAADGRGVLEEGRDRLQKLRQAGDLWKGLLQQDGRWDELLRQAQLWDEAFFDVGREAEPWRMRWDEVRKTMEAWK